MNLDKVCQVESCRRALGRKQGKYCSAHYYRLSKGLPLEAPINSLKYRPKPRNVFDDSKRFWSQVEKTDTCWRWKGLCFRLGYGSFWNMGRLHSAHRISYQLSIGPIPVGIDVLHRCNVRNCVRPDHLYLGTQKDNMRDMILAGNSGTLFGEKHHNAKLTWIAVKEIRSTKEHASDLARKFGVSVSRVKAIRRGIGWNKHKGSLL